MTLRRVIARWVNEKLDFPLKLHVNRVFCLFEFLVIPGSKSPGKQSGNSVNITTSIVVFLVVIARYTHLVILESPSKHPQ